MALNHTPGMSGQDLPVAPVDTTITPPAISAESLKHSIAQMSSYGKRVFVCDAREELKYAIGGVNEWMKSNGKSTTDLCPPAELVFEVAKMDEPVVVIVGQDPYHDGSANGYSFACSDTSAGKPKLQPSLAAIFACLRAQGLIARTDLSGDLSTWTAQGVMLINSALTTTRGTAGAHIEPWQQYFRKVITNLVEGKRKIFILLGAHAQKYNPIIGGNGKHRVLTWGHPSPLNAANRKRDGKYLPTAFVHCDCFMKANLDLISRGMTPIAWNSIESAAPPPVPREEDDCGEIEGPPRKPHSNRIPRDYSRFDAIMTRPDYIFAFTDGGAKGNRTPIHCKAAGAYVIVRGGDRVAEFSGCITWSGMVPTVAEGAAFPPSNNRGELLGLNNCMEAIIAMVAPTDSVIIVSDSEYSIMSITKWVFNDAKKNPDMIPHGIKLFRELRGKCRSLDLLHIHGHQKSNVIVGAFNLFVCEGNARADKLAEGLAHAD